jgi:thioredoxin 1
MQEPILKEMAKNYATKIFKIGRLNVDEVPKIASRYQIMSIPTLMLFKNGQPVEQMIGVQGKEILTEKINQHLA